MKIGLDFDNTIICYDGVFHAVAVEWGLLPADIPTNRESVRDYLNNSGHAEEFTRLQGYVYGPGIEAATLWPGVDQFIGRAVATGHELHVVSHKTRAPISGPAHDLRGFAVRFLKSHGLVRPGALADQSLHFEDSQADKASCIQALELDVFVDDLPDFLGRADFPKGTQRILFDPHWLASHESQCFDRRFSTWTEVHDWVWLMTEGN